MAYDAQNVDSDDDLDSEYSGGYSDVDGFYHMNTDLSDINRTTKDLNIVNTYRPHWSCEEAFRESYQNWRDGILHAFNLDLSQLLPTYIEKKHVILIEAHHPDTEDLLGFIQFKHDKNGYCLGGLKIVNFRAALKYRNLGTGATTKFHDQRQTGQHGDGMKLSALVYRRNNYNVCYESSSFKWRFIYKKGSLACSLTRIDYLKDLLDRADAKGKPRTHKSHSWEDVCLIVGAAGPTRDIHGRRTSAKRLNLTEFKKWITVTLDINPPQDLIRTVHGDLIRDPRYKGRMYLRGLRLPSGGTNGRNYEYGYNFVEGSTSSDRDALSGIGEEREGIAAIWIAAIRADESVDSKLVSDYTQLLLESINKKGDVMMQIEDGGNELMPGDIARQVWAKMLTLNTDREGRAAFYYSSAEGKDQVHIIKQSLRKNPVPIDPELWRILKKYFLCRQPKDELLHRFKSAEVVENLHGSFAIHMEKLLKCLLLSSPATQGMKLNFVKGEHLNINAGFFSGTWKVHNKWLTWEGAHEKTFCEEDQSAGQELFSCDHAVLQLWDVMISQLMADGEYPQVVADECWLKSMARSRLSQMPRSVECSATEKKGELRVTWESIDSHRHKCKTIRVVLHRRGCEQEHILDRSYIHGGDRLCSCPFEVSQAVSDGVTFTGLSIGHAYVPSVSRDVEGAFISPRPKSTKPLEEDDIILLNLEADEEPVPPLAETDSRSDATYPVQSCSNQQLPCVSDDYEMEDSVSLYQPPSISPPSSGQMAPPTPLAAPSLEPPQVRRKTIQTDLRKQRKEDSHILGSKIEHNSLDWGGSFPGSHDFYRTRDKPEQEIFILKPKISKKKAPHKRVQSGPNGRSSQKKPRAGTPSRAAPPRYIVLSSPESSDGEDTPGPQESCAVRSGLEDRTALPERVIVYRY